MITIISGTNRAGSNTRKVAAIYLEILQKKNVTAQLFALEDLPLNLVSSKMYAETTAEFDRIQNEFMIPANRFIVVTPEYNGSFAGILKTMIDGSDVENCWWHKKVCLAGVASGRAGGLRAMDDLANIFLHLKMNVYYNKLPFSGIHALLNEHGQFIQTENVELIESQVEGFLKY